MTIVHERPTTATGTDRQGPLPELTVGLMADEYRRYRLLEQFGDRAVAAIQAFADERDQAGMGPQHPTIVHPPRPDGKTDYKLRELGDL